MTEQPAIKSKRTSMVKAVLLAGFVESIFVAMGTSVNFLASGGKSPTRLLNFVASGVFGEAAFKGGMQTQTHMALLGLAMHLVISIIWAFLFFVLCSRIVTLQKNWWTSGIGYGILIWIAMAMVVMPLSNAPSIPFDISNALIDIIIIITCAGLPISFFAQRYFTPK